MTQPGPPVAASPPRRRRPRSRGPADRHAGRPAGLRTPRDPPAQHPGVRSALRRVFANPGFDVPSGSTADFWVWASVEIGAEGAMRCLFSILFGAGVVLFTGDRVGRGWLHYRRTFWLLCFGLVDAFLLLWNGDILVTYAIAGALLFPLRRARPRTLLVLAGVLIGLMSLLSLGMQFGLGQAHELRSRQVQTVGPDSVSDETRASGRGMDGVCPRLPADTGGAGRRARGPSDLLRHRLRLERLGSRATFSGSCSPSSCSGMRWP